MNDLRHISEEKNDALADRGISSKERGNEDRGLTKKSICDFSGLERDSELDKQSVTRYKDFFKANWKWFCDARLRPCKLTNQVVNKVTVTFQDRANNAKTDVWIFHEPVRNMIKAKLDKSIDEATVKEWTEGARALVKEKGKSWMDSVIRDYRVIQQLYADISREYGNTLLKWISNGRHFYAWMRFFEEYFYPSPKQMPRIGDLNGWTNEDNYSEWMRLRVSQLRKLKFEQFLGPVE